MAVRAKKSTAPNAATDALWRVAESGDVAELTRVFANGAHVNARNQHGMTALMRAAYHGHERMARALLERGADPNIVRNDKFTALALAAFFGHTEVVKVLMDHGAKDEVVTRCGASAQTWATRRTFVDVARCLESHARVPAPAPIAAPAPTPAPPPAAVIKTLKDPPEIWDLVQVHEVPRTFDARSAFLSRLTSIKASFALRIAAGLVVISAAVVGVLVLRGSQAHSLPDESTATQNVVATEPSAPSNLESTKSETPVEASAPQPDHLSHHSEAPAVNPSAVSEKPSRKVVLTRQTKSRATPDEEPAPSVQVREAPAAPVVASPKVEAPRQSNSRSNTALSPQLIAPSKSATPKPKVIQWP